jgi:hypothetical protein
MKKPAVQGGLSMKNSHFIVSSAPSQAVSDRDSVQPWTCVTANDASQSQKTGPEIALDRGDETAEGSITLLSEQVREAERFLNLLGKSRLQSWLRFINPKGGASEARWSALKHRDGWNTFLCIGNANGATGKGGGVQDCDVVAVPALFVEWDDGATIEEQAQRWQGLGLPEPTITVATGGKSVHCYWVLNEPMAPEPWRVLTARIIAHCDSDTQCSNPSRVMRVPGSVYYDKKTGKPTGRCRVIGTCDARYDAADIEACLPAPAKPKPVAAAPKGEWEPRGLDEINAAAAFIPKRTRGNGTYPDDWHALCGCAAAFTEIGHPDPDGAALALLGHLWPKEAEARQALQSATTREAKSFWAIAGKHGYDLKRSSKTAATPRPGREQQQAKAAPSKPKERKPRRLSHTRAMQCFDRCVEVQAKRERNSLRRRARLLKAAKDLGLAAYINRQEIAQRVLEAKAQCSGEHFRALTAADRAAMPEPKVRWQIPELLPANDLTIVGGRAKVGKTRLAIAMAAAVIRGEPFAGMKAPSTTARVLLVTDDQSDADTAAMLRAVKLWDSPFLDWSPHFRLTESDLDQLLERVKANPGLLVILDSLRSISRALQHGENDPEIGATLYDLKQAVTEAGGTLLLIHHCNKAADLVGTEALSGHNAIAGAANTVITLHHCPDAKGNPDKNNPQRRMFCQGRSGDGCDLVLDRSGAGSYRAVSTFSQWQQQLEEARKQQKDADGLTPTQQQLLDLLEGELDQSFTRRQLVEALELDWGSGNGRDATRVREALEKLARLGHIDKERIGKEWKFRASREALKETSTSSTSSTASTSSDSEGFHVDVKEANDLYVLYNQSP